MTPLATLLPRWVRMVATLIVDGADEDAVRGALRQQIQSDTAALSPAAAGGLARDVRAVLELLEVTVLAGWYELATAADDH